jgi:NitT/TauT family transport system ATP-binding protein
MFPMSVTGKFARPEVAARATIWIERVGLMDFAGAYSHTLSGGMKQRVAVARAMAMEPEVLLMDEPFAALDALTRAAMQKELCELWRDTAAILVFVTHSIEEAIAIGHRLVILSARPGWIIAEMSGLPGETHSSATFVALRNRLDGILAESAAP